MSEQPNTSHPDATVLTQDQQRERPQRRREPSMQEIAELVATRLGATEETAQTRIRQIVWDLGRAQAQALCTEALESAVLESQGGQALVNQFFVLVETKGVKKQRPWYARQDQEDTSGEHARTREVTRLIAEQLGERDFGPRQIIHRSVRVFGVETALALLQQTHETEAAGGMLLPDGSRRRTPGGVYFLLVRQQASTEQRKQIFPYHGPKAAAPQPQSPTPSPKQKQQEQQVLTPSLTWAERGQLLDEANQHRGEAKTVKMTVIGRPGKIVEREIGRASCRERV